MATVQPWQIPRTSRQVILIDESEGIATKKGQDFFYSPLRMAGHGSRGADGVWMRSGGVCEWFGTHWPMELKARLRSWG